MNAEEMPALSEALAGELQNLLEQYRRRIAAIQVLLGDTDIELEEPAPRPRAARTPAAVRSGPGVSETVLKAVRNYMQAEGQARQVDVSKNLELNSGSASLALRWLQSQGEIEDIGVQNKSKVWKWTGVPKSGNSRRARIDLGTAGRTSSGDRDAHHIAENVRYTTEEPQ